MAIQTSRNPNNAAPPPAAAANVDGRTLGELFNELSEDFSHLIRQEVELARTETTEKLNQAKQSAIFLIAAGLVGYAGFLLVLIALANLLNTAIGVYWISSLIVGAVVLVVAFILYVAGRSGLRNMSVVPEQTIETLKNDAQWAKEHVQ